MTGWVIPKKLLAAVILLSLSGGVAWAAAAETQPALASGTHTGQPVHPMQDHSCCPRIHKAFVPPTAAEFPPQSIPCREHPCCVSHAPDAPPSLPSASGTPGPGTAEAFGDKTGTGFQFRCSHDTFSNTAFHPYPSLSMVLRI